MFFLIVVRRFVVDELADQLLFSVGCSSFRGLGFVFLERHQLSCAYLSAHQYRYTTEKRTATEYMITQVNTKFSAKRIRFTLFCQEGLS